MTWRARITGPALRDLDRLTPRVSEPLVAFIFGSLCEDPTRRGKPLRRELEGRWAARRGDYRVVYRLDRDRELLIVLAVAHRSDVYRPR
jgi:mRNA interferase RelE/StbE